MMIERRCKRYKLTHDWSSNEINLFY